jgi:PAS domain S-box-containing protein
MKDPSGSPLGFQGIIRDMTDRKEAEEALKRSEKRYRDIFENAVEGIFQSIPEGKYLRVNPAMARMCGYGSPEELIREITNIGEQMYVYPEDWVRFREILDRIGILERFEMEALRKDGERMWISQMARAIRDESGKVLYYEGTVENINDRKQVERKFTELNRLREQLIGPKSFEQKLKIITDGLVHIFQADFARIWTVNPGDRCEMCLYAEENPEGTVCQSKEICLHLMASSGRYTHIDGPGHRRVPLGSFKIGQIGLGKVVKFVTNDIPNEPFIHNRQWAADLGLVSFAGFQLLSAERAPLGVMALFSKRPISKDDEILMEGLANSTAQVIQTALIEESLKESEERYRTAIEHSNDGFALVKDGIHLYVNQKMCRIFDYDRPEEIIGKPIGLLTHPDDYERVIDIHKRRDRGEAAPSNYEFKGRKKDGEPVFLEISVSQTIYKGEQVILAYLRDITERKRAEEERRDLETRMQEVQKLESLGVLAGGIAHDFNNLLMAILGNADLALFSLSPVSPARHNIEEILRASQRAADLCRQMLAYSGKGRFVVGRYNLAEIIQEMTQMLEVSISKKAVLHYAFADSLPAVEVDATQMRQVIMNLITNASEALGEKSGTISISCGVRYCDRPYLADSYMDDKLSEGHYVFLEVADTGEGMDEETQRRLFEPFYSTKFTGRGLGLAAVLGIVRGHKGAIKVQSTLGQGTTFRILLPALAAASTEEGADKKETGSIKEGAVILLVDDDYHVRKVGSEMLKRLGFKVLTAVDGREGLETFRNHQEEIDCVVLDLSMPEMGGEEAFHQFLLLKPDLPVILSSGYNEQDVVQRFNLHGVAGFIQKPYTVLDVRETLKRVLR